MGHNTMSVRILINASVIIYVIHLLTVQIPTTTNVSRVNGIAKHYAKILLPVTPSINATITASIVSF